MRERILKDGAIPTKYKPLMAMITDAIVGGLPQQRRGGR
jgi:hypothetical protein